MRSTPTGSPFYYYGHPQQIQRELTAKDKNNPVEPKKYPAVFLKLDTRETISQGVWKFNLNLAIVAFTDKQYRTGERYENVFKPVLYPLYDQFLQAIVDDGRFMWAGEQPEHTKIDRPYWGTEGKERNTANAFSDPLDAIEILNLQINALNNC